MSKSPSVLVSVGAHASPKLPRQDYDNIFTEYNMGMVVHTDGAFFNKTVRNPQTKHDAPFDIYGFMPGSYSYFDKDSVSTIVNFFNKNQHIEIVLFDAICRYPTHDLPVYVHPEAAGDSPFFIRKSLKDKIQFDEDGTDGIMWKQLLQLRQAGHIIFHIAKPLVLSHKESSL